MLMIACERLAVAAVRRLSSCTNEYTTLAEMLDQSLAKYGRSPLFGERKRAAAHVSEPVSGEYAWTTYAQFGEQVERFCRLLASRGLGFGQTLAIISNNRSEWAVAAHAAYRLGMTVVPMYEQQKPKEWDYIIRHSAADALVVSQAAMVDALISHHGVPSALTLGEHAGSAHHHPLPLPLRHVDQRVFACDLPPDDRRSFFGQPDGQTVTASDQRLVSADDVACVIYTSGTTGVPKGCVLTHGNIVSNVQSLCQRIGEHYEENKERHLSFLPWAHVYGQTVELHFAVSRGSAIGIVHRTETLMQDIMHVHPTILVAVPQMFYKISDRIHARVAQSGRVRALLFQLAMAVAKRRREALNRGHVSPALLLQWRLACVLLDKIKQSFGGALKYTISGGGHLPADVQSFFGDMSIPVIEGYGLSETSPIVACEHYALTEHLQGGLRALPNVELRIYEPGTRRRLVEPGVEGEICVIGPNVMRGYLHNEAETNAVIFATHDDDDDRPPRRCFRTGDLGRLSADGVLTITGRCKEQYKLHNGKYVMPSRVEEAMLRSRYVDQVMVHGANQPHNVALVVPDMVDFKADHPHLIPADYQHHTAQLDLLPLLHTPLRNHILDVIVADINRCFDKADLPAYERVKRIHLVDVPFSVENGLLTQKLSMKRKPIYERYHAELNALYH